MKPFEKVILEEASNGNTVLVFPSEVAAHFWRRRALDAGHVTALAVDRFLSWDSFKERTAAAGQLSRPANRAIRLMFTAAFLQKVAAGDVSVESIIPPSYAWNAPAFTSWLSGMLPGLSMLRRAVEAAGGHSFGPVYGDLVLLEGSYREFLDVNGFFEPSWQTVQLDGGNAQYLICFPEVIEDYEDYAPFLSGPAFKNLSAGVSAHPAVVRRFETTLDEMDHVLTKISEYLDGGMNPRDIVITLPDGDEWRYLEEEARLYGVPLDARIGKSPGDYRGAALFVLLSEAVSGGLELGALESLFLDRAFPWKDREAGMEIVRFGREHSVVKNYGKVNLWKYKLTARGRSGLWKYLDAVASGVKRLSAADTFGELRVQVYAFVDRFLDPEAWSATDRQVFRYALDSIGELVKTEELLSLTPEIRPFRLWLSYLSGGIYVPRGSGSGVRVFPYGVTAGIMVPVHFIPGADQAKIRRVSSVPGFLREDQRRSCGITDRDLTDDYLSLYMVSGEEVFISYSSRCFEGPGLTPSLLLDQADTGIIGPRAGLKAGEENYWNGTAALPNRLPRCVTDGFRTISFTAFRPVSSTFHFDRIPELSDALAGKRTDDEGLIVISPTALDSFAGCRFRYLLNSLLDVEDSIPAPGFPDPFERGIFLHTVLYGFMDHVRKEGQGFLPQSVEGYLEVFRRVLRQTAREWEREGRAFIEPVWRALLEWTEECGEVFIASEAENFPGYKPVWLEKSLNSPLPDAPVRLKGFVDRFSVLGNKGILIDYKTRVYHKKAGFTGDGPPGSYQLPVYAYLAAREGYAPDCAAYYDITEGTFARVFDADGGGWAPAEVFAGWTAAVPDLARDMAAAIGRGDYSFPEDGPCEGCDYRMVCRERFFVRFNEGKGNGA